MDTNMDKKMDTNMDTSISTDPEELILDYSSPTLIDVIDLTKESPRNRSSLLPSCHRWTENVSNYHITRSSRRNSHRNVLLPIILGEENTQIDLAERTRVLSEIASNNEIVNFDNTVEIKEDKEEAEKQDKDKDNKQKADEYEYTFESDNRMPVSLTCPICLETLSSRLKPTTTRCGHLFCENCLKESIKKYKHCPTCKTTIKLKSCIRVYF